MNLQRYWQSRNGVSLLLWPVSILFRAVVALRKTLYRSGLLSQWRAPLPVVVVGNIAVGGTGKTPLTVALVQLLQGEGYSVGVVSRGYGGQKLTDPLLVSCATSAAQAGDEPVMIVRQTGVPLCVFPQRSRAIEFLLQSHKLDVVLCDDGLQHYALQRDLEIAVVDAQRLHGNGFLLPAGPLREPVKRLQTVDMTVLNRGMESANEHDDYSFALLICGYSRLDESEQRSLQAFHGQRCHAVAGIANPERFFMQLEHTGIDIVRHQMPDHHQFCEKDFSNWTDHPVIMTEKDAVKCRDLDIEQTDLWYTTTRTDLSTSLARDFVDCIGSLLNKKEQINA